MERERVKGRRTEGRRNRNRSIEKAEEREDAKREREGTDRRGCYERIYSMGNGTEYGRLKKRKGNIGLEKTGERSKGKGRK